MKRRTRAFVKLAAAAFALLLIAGIAAPYLTADRYGERLRSSIERALGRRVLIGKVHFSLLEGPAFTVDSMTIFEDPAIGLEPIAYVQDPGGVTIAPSLWSLAGGRFVISSISLDGASLNLTRSGPAPVPGRWNFETFVNRSVMRNPLAIHIRNSRVNFKFGDTKSVFYLTDTDLDISPPRPGATGWNVKCSARPARTDRSALGLGSFRLEGRWYVAPERLDLDLTVERTELGEWNALFRGQTGNVHGTVTSTLHIGGPIDNVGIEGRIAVEDVHRWDLMPPYGQNWPLEVRGRLDLLKQVLELESTSSGNATLPLAIRFRATEYLTQPRWAVAVNWNRFPVEPLMQLAAHMGAQFPAELKLSGTMDGAIGYSGQRGLQGELALHDGAIELPDSPAVRVARAYLVLDGGHIRLSPADVLVAGDEQAQVEADYTAEDQSLDLSIRTDAMNIASLRAQVSRAAVPWLEQVRSGEWSGTLRYHRDPTASGWTGQLAIRNAELPVQGLAEPLQLISARAQISGARVIVDRLIARAGKVEFGGEYRYEAGSARPHRVRLRAASIDAADLEAVLLPTLRRSTSLIARALGRASVPAWIKDRAVEGSLQIDDFAVAGAHLEGVKAKLVWDVTRIDLDPFQATVEDAPLAGKLTISLRTDRPGYKFTGNVKGLPWQSGKLDAEGTVEASGTGAQLLSRLVSEGTFTGMALDFGSPSPWRSVSGTYSLAYSPRLRLTNLTLKLEDEAYTGRGATQDDGRLVIQLTSGTREIRIAGTPAKLKFEDAARP
jgi:hypothetical protein